MEGATAIARQPKLVTLFKCIETQKDRYVERENQQNQTLISIRYTRLDIQVKEENPRKSKSAYKKYTDYSSW